MQRRHDAHLGAPIESGEHDLAETLVEVTDRCPVHLAMAAVDLADQPCKFTLQEAIGLNATTRWCRNLQQRNGACELWLHGPHAVERIDAIDEPLGIVQSIDANGESLAIEAASQTRNVRMRDSLSRLAGKFVGIDPDGKHRNPGPAIARHHNAIFNRKTE